MHRVFTSLICYKMVTKKTLIEHSKKSLWSKTDYPFTKNSPNNNILLFISHKISTRKTVLPQGLNSTSPSWMHFYFECNSLWVGTQRQHFLFSLPAVHLSRLFFDSVLSQKSVAPSSAPSSPPPSPTACKPVTHPTPQTGNLVSL